MRVQYAICTVTQTVDLLGNLRNIAGGKVQRKKQRQNAKFSLGFHNQRSRGQDTSSENSGYADVSVERESQVKHVFVGERGL